MTLKQKANETRVCPKTGRPVHTGEYRWARWVLSLTGLVSLIWFLVRVIPKPARAAYPCQRMAAPLASGFVVWLLGIIGSSLTYRRARQLLSRSRYVMAAVCAGVAVAAIWWSLSMTNSDPAGAAFVAIEPPNNPIGVAKGLFPGRVVWVHDPNATDWDGPGTGDRHWWDGEATDQREVERMLSAAVRSLAGVSTDADAWRALFTHFNTTRGKGEVGYQPGEKIMVKLNLVQLHFAGNNVDAAGNQVPVPAGDLDVTGISPQLVLALVRQLVYEAAVKPEDITLGDTLTRFSNQYWEPIHGEFPEVNCLDYQGVLGRRKPVKSTSALIHWSNTSGASSEGVATCFAEAQYVINFACLKAHPMAGVTLCGKNHFGSLCRTPANFWKTWDKNYVDLHADLPNVRGGMGKYRAMVDLMGSQHLGGKTLLYLIDGLYGGDDALTVPRRWEMTPFQGDWPSSLFASQDPVAIDSVAFDFLRTEFDGKDDSGLPLMNGADDYLHEAALADNPASGTFYDPDYEGNITRLDSLGVHEHWNNAVEKLYSRNLGMDQGIELVALGAPQDDFSPEGDIGFLLNLAVRPWCIAER